MSAKRSESRGVTKPLHYLRTTRFHELMKMAAMPLLFLLLTAAVRGQSALDGFDPNANGTVRVVVVQPDGKILIGGDFTTLSPNGGAAVTRNRIARLNPDGTLDTAFDPNANGSVVYSIALQADGKILAGGFFTSIGGQTRNNIARLDATTGLADSFDPNANSVVYSIAVQADGKIFSGRPFQRSEQHRRTAAQLHCPARCHDRIGRFVRPERERQCYPFNRGAGGRQDFGGRRFHQHWRTDAQLHRPARCHDRLG